MNLLATIVLTFAHVFCNKGAANEVRSNNLYFPDFWGMGLNSGLGAGLGAEPTPADIAAAAAGSRAASYRFSRRMSSSYGI